MTKNKIIKLCSLLFFCLLFLVGFSGKCKASILYQNETSNNNYEMASTSSMSILQVFYSDKGGYINDIKMNVCRLMNFPSNRFLDLKILPVYVGHNNGLRTCPTTEEIKLGSALNDACFSNSDSMVGSNFFQRISYTDFNTLFSACGGPQEYIFNNPTIVNELTKNLFYYVIFSINANVGITANNYLEINQSSFDSFGSYAAEQFCHYSYTTGNWPTTGCTNGDLTFTIDGAPGHSYSIEFVLPEDGKIYKDFNQWTTEIDTIATTSPLYSFVYFWPKSSSTSIIINQDRIALSGQEIQFSQAKIGNLPDGYYQAQAKIKTGGLPQYATNLATSSIIDFEINQKDGESIFPALATSSPDVLLHICDDIASSSGSTFDDLRYGVECGARKLMYYLIYPSDDKQNDLHERYYNFKATFPFSAFFGITDTINEAVASSTTNQDGNFQIPFIDKSGNFEMLTVMSSSSLPNLIGQNNANIFRSSLSWILWALCAFLIFCQLKRI